MGPSVAEFQIHPHNVVRVLGNFFLVNFVSFDQFSPPLPLPQEKKMCGVMSVLQYNLTDIFLLILQYYQFVLKLFRPSLGGQSITSLFAYLSFLFVYNA